MQLSMALVSKPIEQKRRPRVMIDAQFSVPFNVALGLLTKRLSFVDFTSQNFAAPEIRRLMGGTTCCLDPALDAQYPAAWPARVSDEPPAAQHFSPRQHPSDHRMSRASGRPGAWPRPWSQRPRQALQRDHALGLRLLDFQHQPVGGSCRPQVRAPAPPHRIRPPRGR
jgi:MmgE/PrpD C-terminal domain